MNDLQLLRYSRQIMLPQVDIEGQQKLLEARILIIGMGGLGSPAAMYLSSAGVGCLALNDFDRVELSNLQRQIAHDTENLGVGKAESAKQTLLRLNPECHIDLLDHKLEEEELELEIAASDVILDCTDNFATRFAVNRACVRTHTPLVSGAVIRFEGQITVFTPGFGDSPCYNCLYADQGELEESCVRNGVIAPLPGIIGSMQALEAIKLILEVGQTLRGRLLLLDALSLEWREMKLSRNLNCPTCAWENADLQQSSRSSGLLPCTEARRILYREL
ncbi:MAG: molybdopterin-synthase adenylyltransferase MoeB [Methylococcaceae bacterium]|nr:molybdopterin-synthase adenylyltransferase MoeB [Methylococcaceae bacterium]